MKNQFKKVLALLTAIALLISCIAMALAEEQTEQEAPETEAPAVVDEVEIPAVEDVPAAVEETSEEEGNDPVPSYNNIGHFNREKWKCLPNTEVAEESHPQDVEGARNP